MNQDPCIVIVYSAFGDGHLQAARAIKQSFSERGIGRVHLIDLLAEAHPWWNAVSRFCFLKSSAYFPKLYGLSYRVTNSEKPDPRLGRLFHSIGKRKMRQIIARLRPDAVIHTFPYLAMSELGGGAETGIPSFTVLTDYVLHSRWVHPGTDRYFVATEHLKRSLMRSGVAEERIAVSGIPVRKAFEKPPVKEDLHAKLGLDPNKRYVLLSAGAYGVQSHVNQLVNTVLQHSEFDLLLVCGKNRKLFRRMDAAYSGNPRIRVMGYAERMEEWMAVSSCLLTKAGGITLTEALSLSLPVIVYRPVPGQEKGNADMLSSAGAIYTANHPVELAAKLRQLERDGAREAMERAMKRIYRAEAAGTIVSDVLHTMEHGTFLSGKQTEYVTKLRRLHPAWTRKSRPDITR